MPTVLVVDDHDDIRTLVAGMLRHWGYSVYTASDGLEAVQRAYLRRPDLILIDLSMPLLNGWAAISLLKKNKNTTHIPIIAVSTADDRSERMRTAALGCMAHLGKPIDFEALHKLVTTAAPLEQRQTIRTG